MVGMKNENLVAVERTLTSTLVGWSAASVVVGTVAAALGRRSGSAAVHQFGRQTAAWGAVDAAIAGIGHLSQRRRGELSRDKEREQARRLRTLLVVNSFADVGYIAAGLAIMGRGRQGQLTFRMGAGDGAAIVVQGAFLLVLDATQAMRLGDRDAHDD